MSAGGPRPERLSGAVPPSLYEAVRESFLTGVALVVPAVVSLYVLILIWGAVAGALRPVVATVEIGLGSQESQLLVQVGAAVFLAAVTLGVGFLARFSSGERAIDYVDDALEAVPGFGTIYSSFRRMSDALIDGDARHFREVKLVEFPHDGTYTLGFETASTPESIESAADEQRGMRTLFLPLAPNPVMGGFLAHVPEERVRDVDMTVDEGISTIVTTGVATAGSGSDDGLDPEALERLTGVDVADANRREDDGSGGAP